MLDNVLSTSYFNFPRNEILSLIPGAPKRHLDIGCATGLFGSSLKRLYNTTSVGIEINRNAAAMARKNIDYIFHADINNFNFSELKTDFDLITFNDILEHLTCPTCTLKKSLSKLTDDGHIIASIPNVAHPYIIQQLSKGLFRYTNAGILDNTHLRFFTLPTICQMFIKAGLKIKKINPYPSKENPIQYHILAKKIKRNYKQPGVTIIIPTFNCLNHTRLAYESLKRSTTYPYQLIIIDNASTDDTINYIRTLDDVYHIENTQNLGFPTAVNLGLELVKTPYFVIANNDLLFTKHWLERLVKSIETDPKLSILGVKSNFVSGPQLTKDPGYKNSEGLNTYVESVKNNPNNKIIYKNRIVFLCTILQSHLLYTIGLLDENFGLGNFEDDDYCLRTIKAGLHCAYDEGVYIHHFGSRSFINNKINYNELIERNKKYFMLKHNIIPR